MKHDKKENKKENFEETMELMKQSWSIEVRMAYEHNLLSFNEDMRNF